MRSLRHEKFKELTQHDTPSGGGQSLDLGAIALTTAFLSGCLPPNSVAWIVTLSRSKHRSPYR